jgi:hypothetical protein
MKKIIILCFLAVCISGCNSRPFLIENNNNQFNVYKKDFETSFVGQFPEKIKYPNVNIISNTNIEKNDIGLLLFEYDVDEKDIESILKSTSKKALTSYESKDSCLLIINPLETKDSYTKFEKVKVLDTLEIDKECATKLYPIPNFISSNYPKGINGLNLDDSFKIYILDAKEGNHFKKFDVQPSPQMPPKWKNGYSKGIALSRKNKTIIYWSVIW